MRREQRKKREGKKAKRKSEDRCVTFKPQISKFYFLLMPELDRNKVPLLQTLAYEDTTSRSLLCPQ